MRIKDRARPAIPPVEPGVYIGICVGVIDLGEQYSEAFKKWSNDVQIIWELVGETVEVDGEQKPRQLSRTFAFSLSAKSNLRKFLGSWNNRQYTDAEFGELDLFDQLGRACQLQVALSEDGQYSNIANVMALPRGVPAPQTETSYVRWDMDAWDEEVYQSLPQWVQEKIQKSTQYQKIHTPTDVLDIKPEDLPAGGGEEKTAEEECPI